MAETDNRCPTCNGPVTPAASVALYLLRSTRVFLDTQKTARISELESEVARQAKRIRELESKLLQRCDHNLTAHERAELAADDIRHGTDV